MHRPVEYTGTPVLGTVARLLSVAANLASDSWKNAPFLTG
jgi:hypothetical protein